RSPYALCLPDALPIFGIGSKVALSFILVGVLTFFSVYNGIRAVDASLVERVRTLGGGTWVLLREVYVPSVVSWVMSNLRVSVGFDRKSTRLNSSHVST